MISGKSGLFYKLGDYAVIRDGNRDGRKMNYLRLAPKAGQLDLV